MARRFQIRLAALMMLMALTASKIVGQDLALVEPPFVFMDCNARNCDFNHFRQEIPWVNWVRDREDSEVHVLITSQGTAGGGSRYTLDFIMRADTSKNKSLQFTSDPNHTDSEVRQRLTNMIGAGLIQYIETKPALLSRIKVIYTLPDTGIEDVLVSEEYDPWDLWTFRIGAHGSVSGESNESSYTLEGSVNASRVSEEFKIRIEVEGDYEREKFEEVEVDEEETFINVSEDYSADLLTVWSLGPKWSIGGTVEFNRSTFFNRDLAIFAGPAIEYNLYPYSESTRRALTFRYSPQIASFDYELGTVEGKTEEILGGHVLQIGADFQQPWGEIFFFIEGIQYFHDLSTHRINTRLRLEYRLFRGFFIDMFGSFSRIKDQFYLPAEGLSPEEILLRRRQRETDYRLNIGLGISYRFGSKFANVVNTRM